VTVLLSTFGLLRMFLSVRVSWAGTVLVATTPFVVHETYFTWPKLLAASFGVAALAALVMRRPVLAGLLLGLSYLSHPVGLFIALAVGAIWLALALPGLRGVCEPLPLSKLRGVVLVIARTGALMAAGLAVAWLLWRVVNASDYRQTQNFTHYLLDANGDTSVTIFQWLQSRLRSLGNTLVPLQLFVFDHNERHVNSLFQPVGPLVIPFFYQYWNTVPFGVGLVYFPAFLVGLWRFARRGLAVFIAGVAFPFAVFAVYWGSFVTGLMREGLQGWIVFALIAAFLGHSVLDGGLPRRWAGVLRVCVTLRGLEILAMLLVPTVATTGWRAHGPFLITDVVSLAAMFGGVAALMLISWRAFDPARLRRAPPAVTRTEVGGP
jgi:hypothetical protein